MSGSIDFRGRDILTLEGGALRKLRGGEVAMVFQDPMTSLNPVLKIAKQLVETMVEHGRFTPKAALARAVDLLGRMGINAPKRAVDSYPHQFSGGMRQRVMLAMGFSNEPVLLIADEPTTALDVTIQAQILDLLRELNADFGTAIILISHDLGVIANICSRIVVMYAGEVVEEGPAEKLLADPKHPYTWALLNAVPRLDRHTPGEKKLVTIEGTPPDPAQWPDGCRFRPRCPFAIDACDKHPALQEFEPGRAARCWVTQAGGVLPAVGVVADASRRAAAARRGAFQRFLCRRRRGQRDARRSAARTARRQEALPAGKDVVLRRAARAARGRRRRPDRVQGRDGGAGRRIRLRQVDAGPPDRAPARADGGHASPMAASTSRTPIRRRSVRCAGACR